MALLRRRTLLATLAAAPLAGAPAFVRHARAADVPRFGLGVASGWPTAGGVVLWTRLLGDDLPPEVNVTWELAEDDAFGRIVARGDVTARADEAHSVRAEPQGLASDRGYVYRFTALGQRSATGRTRTAPAPGARVRSLRLVAASCQRWDTGHWAAWRDAVAAEPDLVLFLGDYLYEYARGSGAGVRAHHATPHGGALRTLADYRARHAQYKADPALQAAHAAAPWLVTWDDHEVENDYAGTQGQRLQAGFAAQRAAAYQAWWEHMPVPRALKPVDGTARIVHRLDWGGLARIHLLDMRQHRDPQACSLPGRGGANIVRAAECPALLDPARSMLGREQERWLAEGWSRRHPWNLLAQQTLLAPLNRGDALPGGEADALGVAGAWWTDGWDGYPAARERLLAGLAEARVPNAVFVGGDLHAHLVADVHRRPHDPDSPLIASEFCGTSISSLGSPQHRWDLARRYNPHLKHARSDQRGTLRLTVRDGRVEAELRGVVDARDPASAVGTQARFVVEAGRPGAERA
jgi:alkaline phosphatase D